MHAIGIIPFAQEKVELHARYGHYPLHSGDQHHAELNQITVNIHLRKSHLYHSVGWSREHRVSTFKTLLRDT